KRVATALPAILLLTFFLPSSLSQQGTAPATTSKLLQLTIQAPSLKGNLLGDPTEQPVYVYLPSGYESSSKRYPTLYLLHGFTANSSVWINGQYQGMKLQTLMDNSIKNGEVREMIVVAANGSNAYKGSFYTNSVVTGNWEDFIVRDLVNYIDTNYRTIQQAKSRGIAGHSMGGYGSMMLGMKHPEIFSAVYALSPCCLAMEADMGEANSAWSGVLQLTSRDQLNEPQRSFAQFYYSAMVALSAAFSPNPNRAPFFVDFPFEPKSGICNPPAEGKLLTDTPCVRKNEPVYAKWRSNFPVYIAKENKENLKKLRGIFLDYGEKEEFEHIRMGVKLLSNTFSELNIPHQFEVYANGDHGSLIRQRMETRLLPFFNEKLVFD
ncbi:MAG TPA: alpha/beta fold hydrolase, partial [Pyrinomonadaceae bacterium]|nr:alpha/beta fold hydrolase [Pyrinomonadaceae bacterium]